MNGQTEWDEYVDRIDDLIASESKRAGLTPVSAIRKWAEDEVALGEEQARQWKIRNEEQFLE